MTKLAKSYKSKRKLFERRTFRSLMVNLNGLGGYRLLDALEPNAIEEMIDEVVAKELGLVTI
jgi:hypothetical protein